MPADIPVTYRTEGSLGSVDSGDHVEERVLLLPVQWDVSQNELNIDWCFVLQRKVNLAIRPFKNFR